MKKQNLPWLLALALAVGWTTVEAWRLGQATAQADASQQQQLRIAAKMDASRGRPSQVVHADIAPKP